MLMRRRGGFALIEMIVVVGLISLLTYIGYPYYKVFMRNAAYRSAAREVASSMRTARTEAITLNREQNLEFNLKDNLIRYRGSEKELSPLVDLCAAADPADETDCSETDGEITLRFYPNGTVNRAASLCILNKDRVPDHKFTTRLLFPTTGQVEIVRPQP
ncbi:MAG TPA: prepilin-type N-terminal cleavage/methylation domain-containing protein [Geoalkalibacter subterraneus]|uniref:Type II secretion system protein H n=1 Tax=Geoalkalibacter subterraneus TaxID=483547 RepID=A0A831LEJ5_9BACT|nr:prepilin-type N-terminal cleavage/methylation domain-containing protein [Geoalkalibacter subterraneus]